MTHTLGTCILQGKEQERFLAIRKQCNLEIEMNNKANKAAFNTFKLTYEQPKKSLLEQYHAQRVPARGCEANFTLEGLVFGDTLLRIEVRSE